MSWSSGPRRNGAGHQNSMEHFAGGVALAAITGITYVAYKHPKEFGRLYLYISAIMLICIVIMATWNISISYTIRTIYDSGKLDSEHKLIIHDITDVEMIPLWAFVLFTPIGLYLMFLTTLPYWLLKNDTPQQKRDQKDDDKIG